MASTNINYGIDWDMCVLAMDGIDFAERVRGKCDDYEIDRFVEGVFDSVDKVVNEEVEYVKSEYQEKIDILNEKIGAVKDAVLEMKTISEEEKNMILSFLNRG